MVGRRRRRTKASASHQRSWLWGRHAVLESLRAARWLPDELWFANDLESDLLIELQSLAEAADVDFHEVDATRLTQLVGTVEHQGLAGRMPGFSYDSIEVITESTDQVASLWLVLDRIQDPHNFGAIIRSVEVLGGRGVVVGSVGQAEVTPHVARSSAGAVHHVPIVRVDDLKLFLRATSFQIVVADADAAETIDQIDLTRPTMLLLGNEGEGASPELMELAPRRASIPQQGRIGSLNVGVAAGVMLYEALRQRLTVE